MTPEEKFNQEIWWILQEIKKEQLSTPKGEKVEFTLRKPPKYSRKTDDSLPSAETQRKLLNKLKEWKVLDLEPTGFFVDDNIFVPPTAYLLTICPFKFYEFYCLYESGGSYSESKNTAPEPKISQSIIKPKSLELIARKIGDLETGTNLINFLTDCGVNKKLIEYPQTKWRMVYSVLSKLATSNKTKDKEILSRIICDAVHPIMHKGDASSAENLLNKFNNYLSYDNNYIAFDKKENTYKVFFTLTKNEREKQEKKELESLCQPKNREKISLLRETYQALMSVVEIFCHNFSRASHEDIVELNKHYLSLDKGVWGIIDELQLGRTFDAYKKCPRPFSNLFSAEKELNGKISWDVIRREMSTRFGEIETLYQRVNASDILTEPDEQKQLNDIMFYLSRLKEKIKKVENNKKNKETPTPAYKDEHCHERIQKIQIVRGKMEVEGLQDGLKAIAQTKKEERKNRFPYKLPAGTKWENFTIKFEDNENVFIQAKRFKHNTDYKKMGMVGRGKNPNPSEAWTFMKVLAQVNGELTIKNPQAKDKYKKQKELLAKKLQDYFSLEYDPFYPYEKYLPYKYQKSYKIKITLIPPPDKKEKTNTNKDNNGLGIEKEHKRQTPEVYEKTYDYDEDQWRN